MSQIIEAIKRIAMTAEQGNYYNLPGQLLGYFPPYRTEVNSLANQLREPERSHCLNIFT